MSGVLLFLLIADGFVIAVSYGRYNAIWAYDVCTFVYPLCDYPHALEVAGVIIAGLYFLVRE